MMMETFEHSLKGLFHRLKVSDPLTVVKLSELNEDTSVIKGIWEDFTL